MLDGAMSGARNGYEGFSGCEISGRLERNGFDGGIGKWV